MFLLQLLKNEKHKNQTHITNEYLILFLCAKYLEYWSRLSHKSKGRKESKKVPENCFPFPLLHVFFYTYKSFWLYWPLSTWLLLGAGLINDREVSLIDYLHLGCWGQPDISSQGPLCLGHLVQRGFLWVGTEWVF